MTQPFGRSQVHEINNFDMYRSSTTQILKSESQNTIESHESFDRKTRKQMQKILEDWNLKQLKFSVFTMLPLFGKGQVYEINNFDMYCSSTTQIKSESQNTIESH